MNSANTAHSAHGFMRIAVLVAVVCCNTLTTQAQNLIPNPSFEEADTCLELNTYYYPDTGPLHWFTGGGTTDHFQSCLPYGAFNGVPLNMATFQYPYEGEAYAGAITYNEQFGTREYWMVELSAPLVIGQTYHASFYANAAFRNDGQSNQAWIASSGVGMLFTMESRQHEPGDPLPVPVNHAHIQHTGILADTAEWTLVSGSFVADSAYQYVMLGNHFNNANTDTLHLEHLEIQGRGYTLIDNVCVSPSSDGCPMALGVPELALEGVVLFPNPAVGEVCLSGLPQGTWVAIRDALGRKLWAGNALAGTWRTDVGALARGAYVLQMQQGGRQRSIKFILAE
ncbi:MAG: T9SS type A sorting domain-containing protein [Flavobacteriales bacterium]|nr:T9SS type A sorting domain-containing protein [Flavobacteriales bacterium]